MHATWLQVSAKAPVAYWDGYATEWSHNLEWRVLVTKRKGQDGRSDAQYIIDRLASGLYAGRLISDHMEES